MWKLIVLIGLSVLLFEACSHQATPQSSCHFVMNSEQQRVSWHAQIPITMSVDTNTVSAAHFAIIRDAMNVWNDELQRTVFRDPIYEPVADHHDNDGISAVYFVATDWFGTSDEQARTSMYYTNNQIYEADIRVNTQDFTYALDDNVGASEVDFKALMIHELGHVLGLAHDNDQPSVMNKQLMYGQERDQLYQIDKDSAHCEY